MLKINLIVLFVILYIGVMFSQNLVPNYSFEGKPNCTATTSGELYAKLYDWFVPPIIPLTSKNFTTAGLYDTCFVMDYYGYDTIFGTKWDTTLNTLVEDTSCINMIYYTPYPVQGSSYIGLIPYDSIYVNHPICYQNISGRTCPQVYIKKTNVSVSTGDHGKSFAQVKLKQPLISGENYVVEFYSTLYQFSTYALKVGALVSQDTFYNGTYLNGSIVPQVQSKVLQDPFKWHRVIGSFQAQGGEKFLTLGNFYPDSMTYFHYIIPDTNICNSIGMIYYFDAVHLYLHTDTLFNVSLPRDTTLCDGQTLDLYANHDRGFKLEDTVKTFLWSTGSTDSSITITGPGTYWVKVEYNHRFWQSDTIVVYPPAPYYESDLETLIKGCLGDEIKLSVRNGIGQSWLWNTGEKGRNITVADSGWYWVNSFSSCDTLTDSVLVIMINCDTLPEPPQVYIPTAFTPNKDGLNDTWEIVNLPPDNELKIFNRWGALLYHQRGYDGTWDGTTDYGEVLTPGIYLYHLRYTYWPGITESKQGWLSITGR